jgi:hypothetical protein
MNGCQVALLTNETCPQITLIWATRTVTAMRRDLRQIGGYFALCVGRSRQAADRISAIAAHRRHAPGRKLDRERLRSLRLQRIGIGHAPRRPAQGRAGSR